MIESDSYLEGIAAWLPYARQFFYQPSDRRDLLCYGTGYDSWGVQTNQKAFAAFAISGVLTQNDRAIDEALRLLRFSLETHIEGTHTCTDGRKWGHTWISALGTERMMHAVEAIRGYFTDSDEELLRRVLLSESRWLLDNYEIVAGLDNSGGKNKPESNLWNGALLYRASVLYPGASGAKEFQDKAFDFFVNAISIPEDEKTAMVYDGKRIAPYFKGANFFPSYALNHHGYLNVGYMVICLSQIAMLHLWCEKRGFRAPEILYHHAENLWQLVKTFTFPDGRLMRIGGDTRARYCYCQDYLIPSWILILDRYQDQDAVALEEGWLSQVRREQKQNGNGGFISDRGQELMEISQLYYTRLDSDRACSLSMGAWWRRTLLNLGREAAVGEPQTDKYPRYHSWTDAFHGSFFHESEGIVCSFTWEAAEGPTGLYLPSDSSDLAEWRHNLTVHVRGEGAIQEYRTERKDVQVYPGGALTSGSYDIIESVYIAEGESDDKAIARVDLLYALLPDSCTAILIQHAISPVRTAINEVRGLFLQVPNDIWNGNRRTYTWSSGATTLAGFGSEMETIEVGSNWIDIDKRVRVERVYGREAFTIHRPGRRQIGFKRYRARSHLHEQGMLYCDEICGEIVVEKKFFDKQEIIADNAYVLRPSSDTETTAVDPTFRLLSPHCRSAEVTAEDGNRYLAVLPLSKIENVVLAADDIAQGTLCDIGSGAVYDIRNGRVTLGDLHTGKILKISV